MKRLVRSATYRLDPDDIEHYISRSNPLAATRLVDHIDDQFARLTDPNFPRRVGRVKGTFELVVGKRHLVIFIEDAIEITALNVLHAKRRYP
jgi:toxin ParE1/3/4